LIREIPEVTEIQPGSFIFMDAHYSSIGGPNSVEFKDFRNSLSVYTTVISTPRRAGHHRRRNKALSTDESLPVPEGTHGN